MPQLPESLDPRSVKGQRPEVEIEWRTISYRTIWTLAIVAVLLAAGVVYFFYAPVINAAIAKALGLDKPATPTTVEQKQAKFLNIDGKVMVKKANAFQWTDAS